MNLILRNEEFLSRSLEDFEAFGWPVVLENPLGERQELKGQVRHINLMVDMDTGSDIQQEQASATLRLSTITIGEPEKYWLVGMTDTNGNPYTCYVATAIPDRTFGMVVLKLKLIENAALEFIDRSSLEFIDRNDLEHIDGEQ